MDNLEQVLAKYFAKKAYGSKAPTGTPTTNNIHGPGGIFGVAGLDEQVISTRIAPKGIARLLQVSPTIYTDPMYPYITGYEESGSEPSGVCDTCISGVTESCVQTAPLGRICRESKELEVNRIFQRINPGEMDLNLVNSILNQDTSFIPTPSQGQEALNMAVAWAMVEIGIGLQNKLSTLMWQGNPTNNTAGGGYKEFMGLDTLIGTNKVDALTQTACSGLDSDVKDFNYLDIGYTEANGNFRIVDYVNMEAWYLRHNADRQGLQPVTWGISIRPEMWQKLLDVWPLAYFSSRNTVVPAGNTNFIDATRVAEMRAGMQEGMYLDTIAGRFPVVTDDGIYEYNSTNSADVPAGSFASTLYFVPLTYLGNRPATYIEHLDYRSVQPQLRMLNETDKYWITDSGRFMWTQEEQKWCFTMSGKIEPRVVLRTPQLAGKIEHILYTPVQHLRSPYQDSDYFFKGGVEVRESPSLWSDWNTTAR